MNTHPALLAGSTSRLRHSLRSVALAAMNGSSRDIARIYTVVRAGTLPNHEALGLLPVIYANLDPMLIPSLDILDTLVPMSTLPSLDNATKTLSCLATLARMQDFPLNAIPNLWPRSWQWIEFIHLYHSCIPALTPPEVISTHLIHSQILLKFGDHPETSTAMFATEGVRRILAKGWATMVDHSFRPGEPASSTVIGIPLLALSDTKTDVHFQEVVDACGGTYKSLAFTLTKNISQVVMHSKARYASTSITPVLYFLREIFRVSPDFANYLLSRDIISSLMDFHPPPKASRTVELCLSTLIQYMDMPPGYPWVVKALRAGLLRHIITSAMSITTISEAGNCPELLLTVLPRSLVSYIVIAEMKKAFLELETMARSEKFSRSALFGHWNALRALVDHRAKLVDAWEATGRALSLACYNLKCHQVDRRECFRRCSICRTAVYCSRGCQRVDWMDGHRDECNVLLGAYLTFTKIGLLSHERNFIRALVHSDYRRLRVQISVTTVQFIAQYPNTLFFVGFDYTGINGVQYFVLPMSQLGPEENIPHCGRIARAPGRLTLHAVRIGHGTNWSNSGFPLYATTSQFHDGLLPLGSERHNGTHDGVGNVEWYENGTGVQNLTARDAQLDAATSPDTLPSTMAATLASQQRGTQECVDEKCRRIHDHTKSGGTGRTHRCLWAGVFDATRAWDEGADDEDGTIRIRWYQRARSGCIGTCRRPKSLRLTLGPSTGDMVAQRSEGEGGALSPRDDGLSRLRPTTDRRLRWGRLIWGGTTRQPEEPPAVRRRGLGHERWAAVEQAAVVSGISEDGLETGGGGRMRRSLRDPRKMERDGGHCCPPSWNKVDATEEEDDTCPRCCMRGVNDGATGRQGRRTKMQRRCIPRSGRVPGQISGAVQTGESESPPSAGATKIDARDGEDGGATDIGMSGVKGTMDQAAAEGAKWRGGYSVPGTACTTAGSEGRDGDEQKHEPWTGELESPPSTRKGRVKIAVFTRQPSLHRSTRGRKVHMYAQWIRQHPREVLDRAMSDGVTRREEWRRGARRAHAVLPRRAYAQVEGVALPTALRATWTRTSRAREGEARAKRHRPRGEPTRENRWEVSMRSRVMRILDALVTEAPNMHAGVGDGREAAAGNVKRGLQQETMSEGESGSRMRGMTCAWRRGKRLNGVKDARLMEPRAALDETKRVLDWRGVAAGQTGASSTELDFGRHVGLKQEEANASHEVGEITPCNDSGCTLVDRGELHRATPSDHDNMRALGEITLGLDGGEAQNVVGSGA
ncbi:hypothetical protein B0H16DRAFT_1688436 [Mycena metata]|uniref:MYND-type domain-containing protein n=1 Tax=Mycena metata TaxID=1033252 RepID=A0AAD7JG43_9AGAR|nr:hypothetical protein B0H16DRAFT_1688436 [Mycena metata]